MISMIASVGRNNELGKDNKLLWHIPADMKFFKDMTMGHKVVMGWNTYKSLPNGNLPGREMFVLSRHNHADNVRILDDIDEILFRYYFENEEVFIIGGAKIYQEFMDYAVNLYLTEIDSINPSADAFFPQFDRNEWNDLILSNGEYKDIKYTMHKYKRKTKKY